MRERLELLIFNRDLGYKWVCGDEEPHGHMEVPMRNGRPCCSCGERSFLEINEAIRRERLKLAGSAA